jgi:prevent-host-death family protein
VGKGGPGVAAGLLRMFRLCPRCPALRFPALKRRTRGQRRNGRRLQTTISSRLETRPGADLALGSIGLASRIGTPDLHVHLPVRRAIVTISIIEHEAAMADGTWTVAEAKAKFSELVDHARVDGPQTITRHGQPAVVVVSAEEWERKTRRPGNLAEFFAESPLRGSGLKALRTKDGPRQGEL